MGGFGSGRPSGSGRDTVEASHPPGGGAENVGGGVDHQSVKRFAVRTRSEGPPRSTLSVLMRLTTIFTAMNKLNVTALHRFGADIEEPDWAALIPDSRGEQPADNSIWREFAHREWLRIAAELRAAGTLASANRHQMQRIVITYVRYDQTCAERFRHGADQEGGRNRYSADRYRAD